MCAFFTVWIINLRLCHVHDPTTLSDLYNEDVNINSSTTFHRSISKFTAFSLSSAYQDLYSTVCQDSWRKQLSKDPQVYVYHPACSSKSLGKNISERNEMAALICFHILGNSNIIFSLFISFFCEEDVTNTNLKKGMNLCVHIGKGGEIGLHLCKPGFMADTTSTTF